MRCRYLEEHEAETGNKFQYNIVLPTVSNLSHMGVPPCRASPGAESAFHCPHPGDTSVEWG